MSMDVNNVKKGDSIIYANPGNGHEDDQEICRQHLEVGGEYIVDVVDIHTWHTDVYLKEFTGMVFNSVMFDEKTH